MRDGGDKVGITTYSCITPDPPGNLLKYLNKKVFPTLRLDIVSQHKV